MSIKNYFVKTVAISSIACFMLTNIAFAKDLVKKDESVYAILSAEGQKKEIIVSDHLHSDKTDIEIKDKSTLNSITNVKGDEKPITSGDTLTWKTNKNDIFYQGKTDKVLPIDVNISYYLNGNKISPKDIAGKSGKVKINIELKNKDSHTANINGKNKVIYTPFTVVTAINLPLDNFKNVKINSGEMLSDGNNQVITFATILGLKDSLGIDESLIDIPEHLTIEADCTNFELKPIIITATPKMIDIGKIEGANNIKDLIDGISKIKDATYKLSDGTGKIAQGAKELSDNMNKLTLGLDTLNSSSMKINDGAQKLLKGSEDALNGAKKLSDGATALSSGTEKLSKGTLDYAKGAEDFATGSKKFADGAVKVADGTMQLSQKTGELYEGLNKLVSATEQIKNGEKQISDGASKSLEVISKLKEAKAKENSAIELLIKGVDGLKTLVSLLSPIPQAKEIQEKLTAGLETQKSYLKQLLDSGNQYVQALSQLEAGIVSIKNGTDNLNSALSSLQDGQKKAADGAYLISKGGESLKSHAHELQTAGNSLSEGANKLTESGKVLSEGLKQVGPSISSIAQGNQNLYEGLNSLHQGSSALSQGTTEFSKGMKSAYEGSVKLNVGSQKLSKGTKELDENMKKFKNEGIDKIDSKVNDKLGNIDDIIKSKDEIVKLSKDYKSFCGIGENMDGNVKFIMRTEEVKAPAVSKTSTQTEKKENKGFLEWLRDIFKKIF
ncbi:MAG: hypothetical protein N2448_08680 [Caloramator sp.]|nr:hypothetical protein [Caloramator sp.]